MKYLELLCPAKDYETGVAAINHGADAIYIGANQFGAREDAGNSLSDIEKLVNYAHPFYVRVYVTVNTIIYDDELDKVKSLIENLHKIGVDAIIIQDLAILEMDLPPIPIFASTQTHNDSIDKIKFLESVGFKRVILARELALNEIKEISNQTNIELEAFVHGALCVSFSGQCYFSQAITGRSANRGTCSQPCRSSYDLVDGAGKVLIKNKHLLSLKDINLSNHLADLIDSGITSFKIEGRLKDISYVKNVASYYNTLLNKIIENNQNLKRASSGICEIAFTPDPERSFNRGFTTYFVSGREKEQSSMDTQKSVGKKLGIVTEIGKGWFTIRSKDALVNGDGICFINPKGVLTGLRVNRVEGSKIFPYGDLSELKIGVEIYRNHDHEFSNALKISNKNRWLGCEIKAEQSDSEIIFSAKDEDNHTISITVSEKFDNAMNADKSVENIINQLSKSGDTIFKVQKVDVLMNNPVFIPTSTINQIRRNLLEMLLNKRIELYCKPINNRKSSDNPYITSKLTFKGNVSNQLSKAFYRRHGVSCVDTAFELQKVPDTELMVTRYCIKYEIGICPSKQGGKQTGELYLRDNKNLYPLEFDCKNCLMKVKSPKE
ncbi:MAG: U32 family peptidase [Bacteroidales bacterium]|nr:MAG: U32 family peptidase [Bacteroidales bacterium]